MGDVSNADLIKGARILDEESTDCARATGASRDGQGLSRPVRRCMDAYGLIALPGLVDLHTHLREPGREDAETVECGTRPPRSAGTRPFMPWRTPTR